MQHRFRTWWRVGKAVLAVVVVIAIGRQFARDLSSPDLWNAALRPGWLLLSGALYLLGLAFSAVFWHRLLCRLGQQPSPAAVTRAYYVGHLGKYVPGKAWALLIRATMIRGRGVALGPAGLSAFYEVLTTMAAGALAAGVLAAALGPTHASGFDWDAFVGLLHLQPPPGGALDRSVLVLLALLVLGPVGIPILPVVFNRIAGRLRLPGRTPGVPLPHVHTGDLLFGLLMGVTGWLFLGGSAWATLEAVLPQEVAWSWQGWGYMTAVVALAYVAGFVILLVPGGLGVREFFLTLLLMPALEGMPGVAPGEGRPMAVLLAVVLRLVWTAAEVLMSAAVYWLPAPAPSDAAAERGPA